MVYNSIDWPSWYNAKKRYFLAGIPVIGPQSIIFKEAKRLLFNRKYEVVKSIWEKGSTSKTDQSFRENVINIIKRYIHWPNELFLPTDRAAIVLGNFPGIWIDPEDILSDICTEYGVGEEGEEQLYEVANSGSFLDFLLCLSMVKKQ